MRPMELAPIRISTNSAHAASRAQRIGAIKFMGLEMDRELGPAPWERPAAREGILSSIFRVIGRLVAARP